VDSINLVQDTDEWLTLVNTVLNLWVLLNVGNCLASWRTVIFL